MWKMPSYKRKYTWHNHLVLLMLSMEIIYVSCTNLYMDRNKPQELGMVGLLAFFLPWASTPHMQTLHYLLKLLVINYVVILLLYVDDIIITGSASQAITDVINSPTKEFNIKDLGPPLLYGNTNCAEKGWFVLIFGQVCHRFTY